jgi:hypothetical protein
MHAISKHILANSSAGEKKHRHETARPSAAAFRFQSACPPGGFTRSTKKSLQIQKLEHILVAQIEWIRAQYALVARVIAFDGGF